jgi:hypothetical protein
VLAARAARIGLAPLYADYEAASYAPPMAASKSGTSR